MLALVQEHAQSSPSAANGFFMMISFIARSAVVVAVGFVGDQIGLKSTYFVSAFLGLAAVPFVLKLPRRVIMLKIRLDLSEPCIETEIKRKHNQAISVYFKTGKDRYHLESLTGLTQQALKMFDFKGLRSQYPPLGGNTNIEVFL